MTALAGIEAALAQAGLEVIGGFHTGRSDPVPAGCRTLLLIGPAPDSFWDIFKKSDEYADRDPDPMDRWSERVLGDIAKRLDGEALFPFGGPPWHPFVAWASRTGQVFNSPVAMLVGAKAGLFVSFRGALALRETLALPDTNRSPCGNCGAQPCLSGCPVGALTEDQYDTDACRNYLKTPEGRDCLTRGCKVRRACPVGQGRQPSEQSEYHMQRFLGPV